MAKEFENAKNALVVHLKGEIDQCAASEIRDRIDLEIMNSSKKNLIIDLDAVTLMDSSGIGLIVGRYKTVNSFGGKLLLAGGNSYVRKMIDLSGIGKIVTMYKSIADADKTLKTN